MRTRWRWVAGGVAVAIAVLFVADITIRDSEEAAVECLDHQVAPGGPRDESAWLIQAVRKSARRTDELFRQEPRDPSWAPTMEREIRRLVSPVLPEMGGVALTALCCHRTACRMVVRVTPELRKSLAKSAARGGGSPFATSMLWARAGFPATTNWINFDPVGLGERSLLGRAHRAIRGVVDETLGFDPVSDYQLERLTSEESIFAFQSSNREPYDALAQAARRRSKVIERH